MKRAPKEIKQQTEEWLDERYLIYLTLGGRNEDLQYYRGALKAVEFLGYEWIRHEDGTHSIFKVK